MIGALENLNSIKPDALTEHALNAGWSLDGAYGRHASLYVKESGPTILIPNKQDLADYNRRVHELITTFSALAGTTPEAIYYDLLLYGWDVVRFRAIGEEERFVDYRAGLHLINGALDMMQATACSLDEKTRGVYRKKQKSQANMKLRGMKMDQTEHGSYVVKLLVPVAQTPMPDMPDDTVPVGRKVTERLSVALQSTREATDRVDFDEFASKVKDGVSANICEAIHLMIKHYDAVEVAQSWSSNLDVVASSSPISFSTDDIQPLKNASAKFREGDIANWGNTQISGYIKQLSRTEDSADDKGNVVLNALFEDNFITVNVEEMDKSDYEKATEAHKKKRNILLTGNLVQNGDNWKLLDSQLDHVLNSPSNPEQDPHQRTLPLAVDKR